MLSCRPQGERHGTSLFRDRYDIDRARTGSGKAMCRALQRHLQVASGPRDLPVEILTPRHLSFAPATLRPRSLPVPGRCVGAIPPARSPHVCGAPDPLSLIMKAVSPRRSAWHARCCRRSHSPYGSPSQHQALDPRAMCSLQRRGESLRGPAVTASNYSPWHVSRPRGRAPLSASPYTVASAADLSGRFHRFVVDVDHE